jgi:hypothetical protein
MTLNSVLRRTEGLCVRLEPSQQRIANRRHLTASLRAYDAFRKQRCASASLTGQY